MSASIFVSHGAPTLALDAGEVGQVWRRVAAMRKPAAIVIASAHWETSRPLLTGAARLATIHDFGGFPDALYRIEYPAAGAPEMARRALELLRHAGFDAALDMERGLDHGAWVPLREMYVDGEVPVVQLSLQTHLGPAHHYGMGRALAALAEEDVWLIGSGSLTHNLYEAFAAMRRAASQSQKASSSPLEYVREFQQWIFDTLRAGDVQSLLAYRTLAPHAQRAHPTEEHLLPLFFAAGAAGENIEAVREYDAIDMDSLAMDVYQFN